MTVDSDKLAREVSSSTGFNFLGNQGTDKGEHWIELFPADHPKSNTFTIRAVAGWRHLEIFFNPGSFSGSLLLSMGNSSEQSRVIFVRVLKQIEEEGGRVSVSLNNERIDYENDIWNKDWKNFKLSLRVGQLDFSDSSDANIAKAILPWITLVATAFISIMPIETIGGEASEYEELPEGASISVQVNKYERNPKNRAAALAIHGYTCKACGLLMSKKYGGVAENFIQVHHVSPVSEIGPGYLIDPVTDLVPLCPNCHSITHRRNPPFSIGELKELIKINH